MRMKFGWLLLLTLAFGPTAFASCATRKNNNQRTRKERAVKTPPPTPATPSPKTSMNIMQEGAFSSVKNAFIALARDRETYEALRAAVKDLPELKDDFFETNALVAVFLGSRRTGGYGVDVSGQNNTLVIRETTPPRDAMTIQALTSPFKIVAVPVSHDQPLILQFEGPWKSAARPYKVSSGNFTSTGGIAGRSEKYSLTGDFSVMRANKLATFVFNMKSEADGKTHTLSGVTTGVVGDDGRLTISRLNSGDGLLSSPHGDLGATGQFTEEEGKLSLALKTAPANVADGFSGDGGIEATATAPAPQKSKSRMGDDEPM